MNLSIIVVNWNSERFLRKCLGSIINGIERLSYEIIVIDNASYDGSDKIIKEEFPSVIFVQSEINLGFSGANNLAYQHSNGETILFLNPDTEIIGSAIDVLYSYLHSLPLAGVMGCKLLNSDLSLQTSCIQKYPTILNQILDIERLKTMFPKCRYWGIRPLFENNMVPVEVEVISGACIMMKRAIFEKAGMFSTDYFMYSEDVDLCYEINQLGCCNYYVGEVEIIHHGGGSTKNRKNNHFSTVLIWESVFQFFKKKHGRSKARLLKLSLLVVSLVRLGLLAFLLPWAYAIGRKKDLFLPFEKWIKILRWSFGLETWVKKAGTDERSL